MATSNESPHTPTPWVVTGSAGTPGIGDGSGLDVAWTSRRRGYPAAANAEFIVRACNAHDAMAEALREIRDTLLTDGLCPFGLAYVKRGNFDKSFDVTCQCNFHAAARKVISALAISDGAPS